MTENTPTLPDGARFYRDDDFPIGVWVILPDRSVLVATIDYPKFGDSIMSAEELEAYVQDGGVKELTRPEAMKLLGIKDELQQEIDRLTKLAKAAQTYLPDLRVCKKCGDYHRKGYICECGWDSSYNIGDADGELAYKSRRKERGLDQ